MPLWPSICNGCIDTLSVQNDSFKNGRFLAKANNMHDKINKNLKISSLFKISCVYLHSIAAKVTMHQPIMIY